MLVAPMKIYDYNTLKDHPFIDKDTIGLSGSPTNILTSFVGAVAAQLFGDALNTFAQENTIQLGAQFVRAPTRLPAKSWPASSPPST